MKLFAAAELQTRFGNAHVSTEAAVLFAVLAALMTAFA
jgi:hypothetical protein